MLMTEAEIIPARFFDKVIDSKFISLWIFLFGLAVFAPGYRPEFISLQTRFALFAREMLRNGISFFPTTYQSPYPDYTAASTILVYLVSLIPAGVTPFTLIFPTAVASALILVFIYKTAAVQNKIWGVFAVLLALLTYDFLDKSRSIFIDQYTSLMTIMCFYVVHSSAVLGKKRRLFLVPLFWLAGFVFRGPIGLIIPASVIGGYFLWRGDYKKVAITALSFLVLLALCIGALLWAAYLQGGNSFVQEVIHSQWAGRIVDKRIHSIFYYWLQGFTHYSITYPMALFVLIYKFRDIIKKKDDNSRLLGYLAIWIIIVLAGLSILPSKHMYYTLPVVPALSLIAAYLFTDDSSKGKLLEVRKLVLGFCLILPIIALCAGLAFIAFSTYRAYQWHGFYAVTLVILGCMAFAARRAEKKLIHHPHRNLMVLTIAAATLITLHTGIIAPFGYELERTGPFIEKTISLAEEHSLKIAFFKINRDGEAIKFMANLKKPLSPEFVSDAANLSNDPDGTCYIATQKDFERLPDAVSRQMHVLSYGSIGHKKCVAFVCSKQRSISR